MRVIKGSLLLLAITMVFFPLSATMAKGVATGCDCGSKDAENPCVGQRIEVVVKAARGGSGYHDALFEWRFNSGGSDAYCGRFANGDYWIAPKKESSGVEITSITGNGLIRADADPVVEKTGILLSSKSYGNEAPEENIVPRLPLVYKTNTSLVAAKQRNEDVDGKCGTNGIVGACIDAYHVVTVLDSVPDNAGIDMLRPNITGKEKVFLTLSDFDFSRIPRKSFLKGADSVGWENIRQRWSHSTEIFGVRVYPNGVDADGMRYSEGGRAFRAHILHHDYGSGMAQSFNSDLMHIFSSGSMDSRLPALAAMLSFGLDIYHSIYSPPDGVIRGWTSGAGQSNGQFLPAVLLAALMVDQSYAVVLKQVAKNVHADQEYLRGPAELRQVNLGHDGIGLWGDESKFSGWRIEGGYWGSMLTSQCFEGAKGACNPTGGPRTQADPYGYIDGPPNQPGKGYMAITAGVQQSLVAAMFLMPEVCSIVNHPPLVEYVDRVMSTGVHASPDPCAAPDPREDPATCDPYRDDPSKPSTCLYYRKTWGPDPEKPGACIVDQSGKGRFTSLHGEPMRLLYGSSQAAENWKEIRGTGSYCMLLAPKIKSVYLE